MNETAASASCNFCPARFHSPQSATQRATVAVSACLAGEKVRYDGADKRIAAYSLLESELNLVGICPELGAGLGVPRPPVQLVATRNGIRALGRDDAALDVTAALREFAEQSLQRLLDEHRLCGYLWKSRSPSCGFSSTPIFSAAGVESGRGSGIQAAYFQQRLPHLSYCEETALSHEGAISVFILRCRLVFDVLYATDASLQELHRHYAFLHRHFDDHILTMLKTYCAQERKPDYLAALLLGCRQVAEEVLLKLFMK